jgi:predicted amidohydrolase YtcJ
MRLLLTKSIAPALVLATSLLPACAADDQLADTLFHGGSILTVSDRPPTQPEALAVKDGKILFVGSKAESLKHQGASTVVRDLGGKALLPAFLDAHSHYFISLTVANQVNVYAPPAGPGTDPAAIVAELVKFRRAQNIPSGVLIQAYGYDDNIMPHGVALSRDDLDREFPDNPVLVGHVSMHGAVMNSAALKKWNITAATKTPKGGVILRKPGSDEPAGLVMETAWLQVASSLPKPTRPQEVQWSRAGQMLYARSGITTAHEGATHAEELEVMKRAASAGANIIDLIAYPFITDLDRILDANPVSGWGKYVKRLKLGGVKITIDGSPQARTAFFTKPYLRGGPSGETHWLGELTFPEQTINQMVKRVYDLGVPLNLHANGDAAIDVFFNAHQLASADDRHKDRRVTLIHAQFARPDQLDLFVRYKVTPSFFTLHTFYFAEAHIANRGQAQASFSSPMRAAIDHGLRPTNHTDFVVAPLDQMFMMWSAVNRRSRAGQVIGPDQRANPLEALKAMTINVAYQYGEQASKGSLEVGKLADLVILDRNPLAVDPMAIKDIHVLETIKEGKTIYSADRERPSAD